MPNKSAKKKFVRNLYPNTKAQAPSAKATEEGHIPGLPVLSYEEGKPNNFNHVMEKLIQHVNTEFGVISDVIKLERYPDAPPPIPIPDLPIQTDANGDPVLDANGEPKYIALDNRTDPTMRFREAIKLRVKRDFDFFNDIENKKRKVFGTIMRQLSSESKSKLTTHDKFKAIDDAGDPLELWKLIKSIHLGLVSNCPELDGMNADDIFNAIRMESNESLTDFKTRFQYGLDVRKAAGEPDYSKTRQAVQFTCRLDIKRFGPYIRDVRNKISEGDYKVPADLDEAVKRASTRTEYHSQTKIPFQPVSVLMANANDNGGKRKRNNKKGKGNKQKKETPEEPVESSSSSTNNKKRASGDAEKEKKETKPTRPCNLCGGPHWDTSCDRAARFRDWMKTQGEHVGFIEHDVPTSYTQSFVGCVFSEVAFQAVSQFITPGDIILDNGATVSVIRERDLLTDIRPAEVGVCIKGVGGSIYSREVGNLAPFGTVYYSPEMPANILCFDEIAERFRVTFNNSPRRFTVHFGRQPPITFKSFHRLYVTNLGVRSRGANAFPLSVEERASQYTKREIEEAREALRLSERLGHPSDQDIRKLLTSGSLLNSPVTARHLERARSIFGPSLAALKGKTVARTPAIARPERTFPRADQRGQVLHVDIMFVEGEPYLVSVSTPLMYTMGSFLHNSRGTATVRKALFTQLGAYRSANYKITTILTDGEGAVSKLKPELNAANIEVNPTGAGQHVPVIERKIRTIKERVRAHINTLPYVLAASLLMYLVLFCIQSINMMPSSLRSDNLSPHEVFKGRKIDFKKDLRVSFGEYVQAHAPSNPRTLNSMQPRTTGCIALLPSGNLQGSVRFFSLATKSIITRDHWTPMPLPAEAITFMNDFSKGQKRQVSSDPVFGTSATPAHFVPESDTSEVLIPAEDVTDDFPDGLNDLGVTESSPDEPDGPQVVQASTNPEFVPQAEDTVVEKPTTPEETSAPEESNSEAEAAGEDRYTDDPIAEEDPTDQGPPDETTSVAEEPVAKKQLPTLPSRYSLRPNRSKGWVDGAWDNIIAFIDHCCFNNISVAEALKKFPQKAIKSIFAELRQMHEMDVWKAVNPKHIKKSHMVKAIRSSMFLKEKYTPDGKFDKLKSRLVAGGHMQDRTLYEDVSSPTVTTSAAFMIAAIASSEKRHVATVDIKGAYLNAYMKDDSEILMRLDPRLSKFMTELYPDEYKDKVDHKGTITVQLKRALYGCVESAKLWYETLRDYLKEIGFVQNPLDICVFNKNFGGNQCTICVHVDDLMITCKDKSAVDQVCNSVRERFKTINEHRGKVHSYLGMTYDFSDDSGVKITMSGYINDVLGDCKVTGTAKTPAANNLYEVREKSPRLAKSRAEEFHSRVAKLLYLAKRVRPDILQPVIFLSGRVREPTEDDYDKLDRVLRYINYTRDLGIVLHAGRDRIVEFAFIDSSFGIHPDFKGHTGILITIGGGPIFVKSTKQKLVTKSSTESELVGMSDGLSMVIWVRNFLLLQGYKMDPATVFQDNKSTITLGEKGRSTSERTRHVHIRYFFIKDRISSGEVKLVYKPTGDMIADILTKPLQGELFRNLRDQLLNWKSAIKA